MANGRFSKVPPTTSMADLEAINKNWMLVDTELGRIESEVDERDALLQMQITAEQQARIAADAAHAGAAAAHTAEQIHYAAGQSVKQKVDTQQAQLNNIIGGPAPSAEEVKDGRLGADGVARDALGTMVREIHSKQLAQNDQTVMIKRGLNAIKTSQASPADIVISGHTLVNLLGRDGNLEKDSNGDGVADAWSQSGAQGAFSLDTVNARYGGKSQRITARAIDTTTQRYCARFSLTFEANKYYIALADLVTDGSNAELEMKYSNPISTVRMTSTTSKTLYAKFTPSATDATGHMALYNRATVGAIGSTWFDGARIYEVSAAEYAKIGIDPEYIGENLAERFPYVDSVQHLVNPGIRKKGKNLLNGTPGYLHANAVLNSPYNVLLNATADFQPCYYLAVPVVPNTVYTYSAVHNGQIGVFDSSGFTTLAAYTTAQSVAFNSGIYTSINMYFRNQSGTTGAKTWADHQLELGNAKTQFEPQNDDYLYLPATLASNVDGSIRDSYNSALGTITRRWETGVVLDGKLWWSFIDAVGMKRFVTAANVTLSKNSFSTKYDGKILQWNDSETLFNTPIADAYGSVANNRYDLIVSDIETGFGETYAPTSAEISAYFYGFQMNNGTVGTPYASGTKKWTPLVSPRATFEGKIADSVVENPHSITHAYSPTLLVPSSGSWRPESQVNVDNVKVLDGVVYNPNSASNTTIAQVKVSKNVLDHVLRKHGAWIFGSASTVADRVAWLKANVSKLVGNINASGSGPNGNKVTMSAWNGTAWSGSATNLTSSIAKISIPLMSVAAWIDAAGFVHFLAFADAAALITNPAVAPIVTASGSGSALAAGTYYVSYAWVNGAGGTAATAEVPVTITAGQQINVTVPAIPTEKGVTNSSIFIGTTANTGTMQGYATNGTGLFIQRAALVAGVARPTVNGLIVPSTVNMDFVDLEVELNVSVLPTQQSISYTPYMLDYQLAKSVEESIETEGAIGLQAGGNQVELLEGIVVREVISSILSGDRRYTNTQSSGFETTTFENRTSKIIAIYKNGIEDSRWLFDTVAAYGLERAHIAQTDYDPTAEYTVTYLPLDKFNRTTNVIDTTVQYKSNPKMVQDQLVQDMADLETQGSINVRAIAELYKKVNALGG